MSHSSPHPAVDLKDVSCRECPFVLSGDNAIKFAEPMCLRLQKSCEHARPICTRTQFYEELCAISVVIDVQLDKMGNKLR